MSAIDTVDHVHVGFFNAGSIGIYWPLGKNKLSCITEETNDDDIIIDNHCLLVGGGSGEHPAMHILNDAAVYQFFAFGSSFDEPELENVSSKVKSFFVKLDEIRDYYSSKYEDKDRAYWKFDKNQWPIETYLNISKMFKEHGLKILKDKTETLLIASIGAIIIEKMPIESIKDPLLKDLVIDYQKNKDILKKYMPENYINKLMLGFELPSEGLIFGRKFINGEIKSGYTIKDWYKDKKE